MSADMETRLFIVAGVGGGTSSEGKMAVGCEGVSNDDYFTYYTTPKLAPRTGETITVTIERNNEHGS